MSDLLAALAALVLPRLLQTLAWAGSDEQGLLIPADASRTPLHCSYAVAMERVDFDAAVLGALTERGRLEAQTVLDEYLELVVGHIERAYDSAPTKHVVLVDLDDL